MLDDLAEGVPRLRSKGASGAILRIEWERINDLDALDSLAELNLIAAAAMIQGQAGLAAEEVCRS